MPLCALKYKLGRQLTDDENIQFFMGYASHWQYLIKPEAALERMLTDPHAFSDLRVNVPLKHQLIFQKIFKIKEGDKMYIKPEDMLDIW